MSATFGSSRLSSNLEPMLESEIQNLLGSIKVRTQGIKATLKRHKSTIMIDSPESNDKTSEVAIELPNMTG